MFASMIVCMHAFKYSMYMVWYLHCMCLRNTCVDEYGRVWMYDDVCLDVGRYVCLFIHVPMYMCIDVSMIVYVCSYVICL